MFFSLFSHSYECKEINFKSPYLFSSEISELIDTTSESYSSNNHYALMEYLNISNFDNYRQLSDVLYATWKRKSDSTYNEIPFSNYEKRSAISEIIKEAKTKRVVILNENHFSSYSRVFARQLITELSKIGFNSLAIEMYTDSSINSRGYPLLNKSYSSEPQFANLLRESFGLNLQIFNYEIDGKDFLSYINKNGTAKAEEYRDKVAAQNLTKYLETNTNSKLIVYCGHQHVYEYDETEKYHPMAMFLKEYSGIDPLTIDQAEWHPYFSLNPVKVKNRKKAIVLYSNKNGYYRTIKGEQRVDMTVLSPDNTLIHNRPHWLFDEIYKPRKIKIPVHMRNEDELIVFAYHKNEPLDESVPVDCQEVTHKSKEAWLSLPKGEFVIVFHSKVHSCSTKLNY